MIVTGSRVHDEQGNVGTVIKVLGVGGPTKEQYVEVRWDKPIDIKDIGTGDIISLVVLAIPISYISEMPLQ